MSIQPRRQRSSPQSAITRVVQGAAARPDRASVLDVLSCDQGKDHDVRMEWETRDGMRTGGMVAFCWTCRRRVPDPKVKLELVPETVDYRNQQRSRELARRARERRRSA
jgi:hypothetical protein